MGLDMYLTGRRSLRNNSRPEIDGHPVSAEEVDLGYWRKHPNLHGFIVREFAEGRDECQQIVLSEENIGAIIAAVDGNTLPPTSGFFFGTSDGSEKEEDLKILNSALKWLANEQDGEYRSVNYQASW